MNISVLKRYAAAVMAVVVIGAVSPSFVLAAEAENVHKPPAIVEEHKDTKPTEANSSKNKPDNSSSKPKKDNSSSSKVNKDDKPKESSVPKDEGEKPSSSNKTSKKEPVQEDKPKSSQETSKEPPKEQSKPKDNEIIKNNENSSKKSSSPQNSVAKGTFETTPAVSLVEDGHVVSALPKIDLPETTKSDLSSEAYAEQQESNSQSKFMGKLTKNKGSNQLFGIGIGLIVLGVIGLAYAVYSQFFYTKHKMKKESVLNKDSIDDILTNSLKTHNNISDEDGDDFEEDIMSYSQNTLKTPMDLNKNKENPGYFKTNDQEDTIEILKKHK